MDQGNMNYFLTELKGYIDEKFGTLKDYIDEKTEALDRKMGVLAEEAQKERALLAEGINTVNEKLDRHIEETDKRFEEQSILYITDKHLENRFQSIEQRLTVVEEKQRA